MASQLHSPAWAPSLPSATGDAQAFVRSKRQRQAAHPVGVESARTQALVARGMNGPRMTTMSTGCYSSMPLQRQAPSIKVTEGEPMSRKTIALLLAAAVLSGCASVSMESKEKSEVAKRFGQPSAGNAGVYIFRAGSFGGALKKDLWINGKCVGESAPNVFFYEEVKGGADHTVSTESEFSPNDLLLKAVAGVNYFVRQYLKIGVFVGGAGLELVTEDEGKKEVSKLELAAKGTCSKPR